MKYIYRIANIPFKFGENFEGLIFLKTDKYVDAFRERAIMKEEDYRTELEMQKFGYDLGRNYEEYTRMINNRDAYIRRQIAPIENILKSSELFSNYSEILKKRRNDNLNKLLKYGVLNEQDDSISDDFPTVETEGVTDEITSDEDNILSEQSAIEG